MNEASEIRADEREVRADEREQKAISHDETVRAAVRLIKWLAIVLVIISVGNFFRSFINQDSTEKGTTAAEVALEAAKRAEATSIESRDASIDTLHELQQVVAGLEAANEGEPALQNQAIIDALAAVARIEGRLCGGPCPEPES